MSSNEEQIDINVTFADGSIHVVDPTYLFEISDIIASMYGMGACKSLTEYINMINNEDPLLLEGLRRASTNRINITNGGKKSITSEPEYVRTVRTYNANNPDNVETKKKNPPEQRELMEFLRYMGADKGKIEEAIEGIKSGKIKASENDYSYITPESLANPDFDFEDAMRKMRADSKLGVNIEVSENTRLARLGING